MAKNFFKANGVEYTEHNVASDLEKRKEMIDMTGQMGVPVIHTGKEVIIGFDEERIKASLGIS